MKRRSVMVKRDDSEFGDDSGAMLVVEVEAVDAPVPGPPLVHRMMWACEDEPFEIDSPYHSINYLEFGAG